MVEAKGKLAEVTGSNVKIDPEQHYDSWSESYDQDLLGNYGYCAHKIAAKAFANVLPDRRTNIIDVGCGTGLVAKELFEMGFEIIDGVDVSKGMLKQARALGIYRYLYQHRIGLNVAASIAGYGGVLCVGSFGLGHMGKEDINNLIDMAKSDAPIVIFMNAEPFEEQNYIATIESLSDAGRWIIDRIEGHNYMSALERPGKLIVGKRV